MRRSASRKDKSQSQKAMIHNRRPSPHPSSRDGKKKRVVIPSWRGGGQDVKREKRRIEFARLKETQTAFLEEDESLTKVIMQDGG